MSAVSPTTPPRHPIAADDPARQALYQHNMALFAQRFPATFERLRTLPQVHSTLIQVGDDDWDVEFQGIALYEGGGKAYARQQCERYDHTDWLPLRVNSMILDGATQTFFDRSMDILAPLGLDQHNLTERPLRHNAYHIVSFGLGLGLHLQTVMDVTDCRVLVVVENNLEFIHHSLRVLDWHALLKDADARGVIIGLEIPADTQTTLLRLQSGLRQMGGSLLDGTRLLLHYPTPSLQSLARAFRDSAQGVFTGLGFMDDNVRMVRNSTLNLRRDHCRIWHKAATARDWPVIVVGSGPSLDGMIDDLRRNAPHALVVAAGTAVPVLLRNGIMPDFCTIMENGPNDFDLFSRYSQQWPDLVRKIVLLGSCTIDPRLLDLFDQAVLVMRPDLASTPLYCQGPEQLPLSIGPTVTNMALSLFLESGYEDLILFGVDMGARDATRHHASDAPYGAGQMSFPSDTMTITVRGNFGGKVVCHQVFDWARDMMEGVILLKKTPHTRIRNCSDGALIKGTQPCLAKKLTLAAPATDKATAVAAFLKDFRPYGHDVLNRAWNKDRLIAEQRDLQQRLLQGLDGDSDYSPMQEMERILTLWDVRQTPALHFMRGTILMEQIVLNYIRNRLTPDEKERVWPALITLLRDDIHAMSDHLVGFITDLDAGQIKGPWLRTAQGEPSEW